MYKQFYIPKKTNTYADALEAYGISFLVREILNRLEAPDKKVSLKDFGNAWLIETKSEITEEQLQGISFFSVLKYLKKEPSDIQQPSDVVFYDFPAEKQNFENLRNERKAINENKELSKEEKKRKIKVLTDSELCKAISADFDVYREIVRNPYPAYRTLFDNIYRNREEFVSVLKEIVDFYQIEPKTTNKKQRSYTVIEKVTSQQLYSPNQGKGLNRSKADKLVMENLDGHWITETMKVYGAIQTMFCQYVKVGTGLDLKIYVPAFKRINNTNDVTEIIKPFKAQLRSSSPIKLDILNLLSFSENFIKRTEAYKEQTDSYSGPLKNSFSGFYSVYQKDLGQNRAVVNISFLEAPDFINLDQAIIWAEILPELHKLISRIGEQGDSIKGLKKFRDFLSSGQLKDFFDFSFWYSRYLMSELAQNHLYVIRFKTDLLDLIFNTMDINLTEVINNEGFQAIADAIRKSTVSLQYKPKGQRQYEIRYGLSQMLQIKSKSKKDLAEFVGDFVSTYNAETARKKENTFKKSDSGSIVRAVVKDEELTAFYLLLDKYSSQAQTIGALLASYGFALQKNQLSEEEKLKELAGKLGYALIKKDDEQQSSGNSGEVEDASDEEL